MNLKAFFASLAPKHWRELGRLWRNHHWERNEDGDVLVGCATIRGTFETWSPDGLGWVPGHNLLTTEGCNYLLSCGIAGGTQYTTFYVAPFGGNVAVSEALTAATFTATQTELTNTHYSETTRVAYVETVPANKALNNNANPATITAATTNVSIYGMGLLSTSTKSATTGVLLAAANYTPVRSLLSVADTLGIKYELSLANVT